MRSKHLGWSALSLLIALGAWYVAARTSPLVPGYSALLATLNKLAQGELWQNIAASVSRVLAGFTLAAASGSALGLLMGWFPSVRAIVNPWVQFIRMVPSIAFLSLVVVFLGIGEGPKVFVIWLAAFLAITVAMMEGVANVDPIYIKAAKVMGASPWTLFTRIVLPASFPYMLVGFRLGLANAWTTVVAAELIAASHGIGYMIEQASEYNETSVIVIGILVIGLIGLVMDRGVQWLEVHLTAWQEKVGA